jgi:hypothetical protein
MTNYWSENEVNYLINNFPNISNIQISKDLKRSIKSIISKSNRLCLKKSREHISKMISKRNKEVGRNLDYVALKEISKKYKTRGEFQLSDSSAYVTARNLNILDDICEHMIKQNFSTPQLILKYILGRLLNSEIMYNTRRIIKTYELDIYFPKFKLAFEYNGKRWHQNDIIDKYKICTDIDILLINIDENSRKYEEDIKNQIVDNLDIINNRCLTNIIESDVYNIEVNINELLSDIIDDKETINICSKYSSFSKFRSENINLYNKLHKIGLINKYTFHMHKRGGITEDLCIVEVAKYVYMSDFLKKSYRFYIWIKKNKKEYLLQCLKLKQNKKLKGLNQ